MMKGGRRDGTGEEGCKLREGGRIKKGSEREKRLKKEKGEM